MSQMPPPATAVEPSPPETTSYAIELYFAQAPAWPAAAQWRQALDRVGAAEVSCAIDPAPGKIPLLLSAPPPDAGEPPQWRFEHVALPDHDRLEEILEQSWWWTDCRAAASRCHSAVRISDHGPLALDYRGRLTRLQQVAAAAVDLLEPVAICWTPTQQLLDPAALRAFFGDHGFGQPAPAGLNVRFFRTNDDPVEATFLMDTLGLSALGLSDLQCRFRGLDPEEVSRVLYTTATYLFERGSVITAGHTVQGPRPNDRWQVERSPAMAPPERSVLDLDPGFPFCAEEAP